MTIKLGETDCSKLEMELFACLQSPQKLHRNIICSAIVLFRPLRAEPENLQFTTSQPHLPLFKCHDSA